MSAQGRQAGVRHGLFAQHDLSRPRGAKARWLHDRPVHRRGDRLHRSAQPRNPGSCIWPTTPSTRRWRSSRSIKARIPGRRHRSGSARLRLAAAGARRRHRPTHARICASSGQDKNTLIFFFSDNGGPGHKPFMAYNTGHQHPAARRQRLRRSKGASGCRSSSLGPAGCRRAKSTSSRSSRWTSCRRPWPAPALPVPADVRRRRFAAASDGRRQDARRTRRSYWRFGPQKAIRRGHVETGRLARLRDQEEQRLAAVRSVERHRRTARPGRIASRNWSATWSAVGTSGTPKTSPPVGTAAARRSDRHRPPLAR